MSDGPGYWMYETTGILRPAVEAYLRNKPLTAADIAALQAYLRQWIFAPVWYGAGIAELRAAIDGLTNREAIETWLDAAEVLGIDPL